MILSSTNGKILLSSHGEIAVAAVKKLFSLRVLPSQLLVTTIDQKQDQILTDFCKEYNIPCITIKTSSDIEQILDQNLVELGICISGISFLLPMEVIKKISTWVYQSSYQRHQSLQRAVDGLPSDTQWRFRLWFHMALHER